MLYRTQREHSEDDSFGLIRMYVRKDLTGSVFGDLTVTGFSHKSSTWNYWYCSCKCGGYAIASTANLRRGSVKTCGCSNKRAISLMKTKNSRPAGRSSERQLYSTYRSAADRRGYEFLLTEEEFVTIARGNCVYCDAPPVVRRFKRRNGTQELNGPAVLNGIDRVDNSKGYILSNCAPCCKACNLSKGTRTVEEYIAHCRRVYERCVSTLDFPTRVSA